jgi:hypothetical protein
MLLRMIFPLLLLCGLLLPTGVLAQDETAPEALATEPPDEIALWAVEHLPAEVDQLAAADTLRDAGANWTELSGALEALANDPVQLADMLWLLNNAPHLDRLELTTEMLLENQSLAAAFCGEGGYTAGSDFHRRYILNYRIDDEPVTNWRSELATRYQLDQLSALPPAEAVRQIVENIARDFRTIERGYFGNLADPVAIDNARAGTERELALLTAAVLRSQGHATRFTRENLSDVSWVEVYNGNRARYEEDAWFPVYPQAPAHSGETSHALQLCGGRIAVVTAGDAFGREQVTGRYCPLAGLRPAFSRDGHRVDDFEHWTVTAWHAGGYVPLDDLGYPTADADYPLTLGPGVTDRSGDTYYLGAPGDYRLQAGVRYPGGTVHVVTHDFSVTPGSLTALELELDTPLELPDEALREKALAEDIPAEFAWINQGVQLFYIHDDAEPSIRTALLLQQFDRRDDIGFHSIGWQTRPEGWEQPADYQPLLEREALNVNDGDAKPVVILLVDGELKLYLRGYNLNVADWIKRQLALPAVP